MTDILKTINCALKEDEIFCNQKMLQFSTSTNRKKDNI